MSTRGHRRDELVASARPDTKDGSCGCPEEEFGLPTVLEAALRDASLAVSLVNREHVGVWGNPAADDLLGMSVAQVAESLDNPVSGPEWRFFDAHGEHFDFIATLDRCIESRTTLPRRVLGVRRPDGSLFWADTEVIPVQACRCGARWYAAIISTDLSERHFAEKVLRQLAFSDPLTGLANRFVLEDRLGQLSLRGRGEGTPATLYYFDLDRFKPVNDRHGHEAGDAVLRKVAERLTKTFRREDTVARLGGDEFAVLARGVGDSAGRAARARRAVQSPMVVSVDRESHPVSVGVSVGYVESGASSEPAVLLQLADRAMYEDKRRRRVAE